MVQCQHGQIVQETLSEKLPSQKWASRVTQGVGPEFNPSTTKKFYLHHLVCLDFAAFISIIIGGIEVVSD
jgi:hypothetical protein